MSSLVVRRRLGKLVQPEPTKNAAVCLLAQVAALACNHFDYWLGAGEGGGGCTGGDGIVIVWPACSLRPSSMWFTRCRSSMLTLYCLAIEVSVSPRATVCVFAAPGRAAVSPGAELAVASVVSPIL